MAQVNYNQPSEPSGGDGNAGVYAILVIIAVLIVGAVLYFSGVLGDRTAEDELNADIDIESTDVPDVDLPSDVEIDAPDINVPDSVTIVD
jgi:cytoskeletal protein RodZ